MNKIAKILVFGAVNIVIGYAIYPIINTDVVSDKVEATEAIAVYTSENNDTSTIRLIAPAKKAMKNDALGSQSTITLSTNVNQSDKTVTQTNKTTKNHATDDPDFLALNHWALLHKEKLFETISANVPNGLADAMKNVIAENNNFLNKPELVQEAYKDENWVYITEQDLRNLIVQNPISVDFNLLKLTCKQLTCEVFGSETKNGTWRKIYWSLLQSLPNLKQPDSSNSRDSISLSDDGISYIYFKLKFSEEADSY